MAFCCVTFKTEVSIDTMILLLTGVVLYFTARIMKKGNNENARLNRLQTAENSILKQLEFHYNLLCRISVPFAASGRGLAYPALRSIQSGSPLRAPGHINCST